MGRQRKARWKVPPLASIISVDNYMDAVVPDFARAIVPLIEVVTRQTLEPSDEPACEVKLLLEQALTDHKFLAPSAARELLSMAEQCIKALDMLAISKPELLRAIASKKTSWPTLYSRSPLNRSSLDKRLETIHFATESGATWIRLNDVRKTFGDQSFNSAKGWAFLLIKETLING